MRFVIAPVAVIVIWAGSAAQAQNAAASCDMPCLNQRVTTLERANDDRLTTGSVGLPAGPNIVNETFIPNPPTLTPYVSALACQHYEQTVTVPTEGGGTQQIVVRRC